MPKRIKLTSKPDSTWVCRYFDLDLMQNGTFIKIDSEQFFLEGKVDPVTSSNFVGKGISLDEIESIELEEYEMASAETKG